MRGEAEIQRALRAKDVRQDEIGRVLGWPQPRVSEWFAGKRKNGIRYDEGMKLIEHFGLLEPDDAMLPSGRFLRLAVRQLAARLGQPLASADPRVGDLARVLQGTLAAGASPVAQELLSAIEHQVEEAERAVREGQNTAAA